MSNAIVPEVVRNHLPKENNPQHNSLNINLKQNIDKRNYDIHQNFTTNTTTNITNQNKKGFFYFIFSVITLPIIIPYRLIKYIFTKYDLKTKFKLELVQIKKEKWLKNYLKKSKDIYDLEEIY